MYKFNKDSLTFENTKLKIWLFFFVIGLTCGAIGMALGFTINQPKTRAITEEEKIVIIKQHNEFSEEKLKEFLKAKQFKFANILFEQFRLESGNFDSPLFRNNNNFSGMRIATSRVTTRSGEQGGYAYYDTWKDCVIDYALRQAPYMTNINTEEEYLQYLQDSKYAEDPDYINKLRKAAKIK
jgi:hypothetical protein